MAMLVTTGAQLQCTFGVAPSALVVIPQNRVMSGNKPVGTIMDNKPMMNIMPFGMCNTLTNPSVASATSAAMGVLTPMPCIPVIAAPWVPGSPTVMIGRMPALTDACKLMCNWGGQISVLPGPPTAKVP
jgi:hypothetical protein